MKQMLQIFFKALQKKKKIIKASLMSRYGKDAFSFLSASFVLIVLLLLLCAGDGKLKRERKTLRKKTPKRVYKNIR